MQLVLPEGFAVLDIAALLEKVRLEAQTAGFEHAAGAEVFGVAEYKSKEQANRYLESANV